VTNAPKTNNLKFKRHIETPLLAWKNKKNRKPLILQGARQVGKTELLIWLGKEAFEDYAVFNFEEKPELNQIFLNTKDPERLIQNLAIIHGRKIEPEKTLIIFDEIQESTEALNSLKYFYEKAPEYAIAAAGSLLGILLNKKGGFPVGKVNFLQVNPLSFSEYLENANGPLHNYITQINAIEPLPEIFFNPIFEIFQQYFICGGMPEASTQLLMSASIEETNEILNEILTAYSLDFVKHAASKDIARINHIWNSIPAQLAKENRKFLYQVVKPGARAREYEDALLWLFQAGLVHRIYNCNKPALPLSAYDDLSAFKLYILDIGLLRQLAKIDASTITQKSNLFVEFKGAFAENYILQSLFNQFDVMPRYWTSDGKAEVDFVIQYRNLIIPCEVKADENVQSKSLTVYHQKFNPILRIRYSLKNLHYRDGLLNIPLFMADNTKKLIDLLLQQDS
jgi:uncharacterized protein